MGVRVEYPRINKKETLIEIDFFPPGCASTRSKEIPLVIDLDHWGDVIGIEALNLCFHGGPKLLVDFDYQQLEQAAIKAGYDKEVDAFYLGIEKDRSRDQRPVDGRLYLDERGRLIGIAANFD
jgi:uncharacterized protein YuzE